MRPDVRILVGSIQYFIRYFYGTKDIVSDGFCRPRTNFDLPICFCDTLPKLVKTRKPDSKSQIWGSFYRGIYCILRCICDAYGKVIVLQVVSTVSTPVLLNLHAMDI